MYMLTQLAKMMFLATFFPMPELEEEDVSKLFWSTSLILRSSNQPYLLLFTPSPPTLPPPFLFWPTSAKCLRNIALARHLHPMLFLQTFPSILEQLFIFPSSEFSGVRPDARILPRYCWYRRSYWHLPGHAESLR